MLHMRDSLVLLTWILKECPLPLFFRGFEVINVRTPRITNYQWRSGNSLIKTSSRNIMLQLCNTFVRATPFFVVWTYEEDSACKFDNVVGCYVFPYITKKWLFCMAWACILVGILSAIMGKILYNCILNERDKLDLPKRARREKGPGISVQ